MSKRRPKSTGDGYTYWVLACPFCEYRRVLYWPGRVVPEVLSCLSCQTDSASLAWRVAYMQFFPEGDRKSWLRLVRAGRDFYRGDEEPDEEM